MKSETYQVWTDGCSVSGLPETPPGSSCWGGWAAIVECGSNGYVLRGRVPDTTNVRMEILAVIEGLHSLPNGARATVHTDSTIILAILDRCQRGTLWDTFSQKDSPYWMGLGRELYRIQPKIVLLGRGPRGPIHKRAHGIAKAEALAGLKGLPQNATMPTEADHKEERRLWRKHLREGYAHT